MADRERPNVDNIKVKVFGEKEGRYDLNKLPKLVHSKKERKPDRRKRQKLNLLEEQGISDTAQSSCDENVFEQSVVEEPTTSKSEDENPPEPSVPVSSELLQIPDGTTFDVPVPVVHQIAHKETYVIEVCKSNSLVPVNASLTAFALQDYDEDLRQLKAKMFVLVKRNLHRFIDGSLHWLYRCSCDSSRSKLLSSMNISIWENLTDVLAENPPCIHSLITEDILNSFERFDSSLPSVFDAEDSDLQSLDNDHIYAERDHSYRVFALSTKVVVCVFKESDHGFVGSDQKGFKCLTCKFNVHNCCHVKCIEEKLGQDDEDLRDVLYEMQCSANSERKVESKPRCLSSTPISFHPPPYILRVLCSSFYSSLPQIEGNLLMSPEHRGSVCPECGSPWSPLNPMEESWSDRQILLFTINKVYPCTVFYVKCSEERCGKRLHFDGEEIGILNMQRYLVAHEVLRDYMFQFLFSSCTLYAFHGIWTARMQDADPAICAFPSYNQLRYAWYSFSNLLDIDFLDGSCCPECGSVPEIVVCDATTVSFRRKMLIEEKVADQNTDMIAGGR